MRHERILFLAHHNSIRSQIAEGLGRALAPDWIEVYSAGVEPTALHPCVVRVMRDVGIDVTQQRAKSLAQVPLDRLTTVITLCEENVWPDRPRALAHHYCTFRDPARQSPSHRDLHRRCREIRDQIAGIFRQHFAQRTPGVTHRPSVLYH